MAGYYSIQLFKNLRPDIEELLPQDARSVVDMYQVVGRLKSVDYIAVLVFSDEPEKSKKFITDLALSIENSDHEIVSHIEYRINKELEYFQKRRPLYMDLSDLKRVQRYISEKIDYEKELYNPIHIFSGIEIPEPKLNFINLERKYANKVSSYTHYPDGYYATSDEKIRTLLVYKGGKFSGVDSAHQLRHFIDEKIEKLNPSSYDPKMQIKFTGGVQDLIEEHASLIADLELATLIVMVLTTLAMLFYFRSASATFALLGSLMIGTLWTFGVSYFVIGYLNANSAFLGAIVIGNGINFGIIFLARYLEEIRNHHGNFKAIDITAKKTITATLTAALAAGLAYGSLSFTEFRGFRQFGIIGLIGMVLCWISAYTVFPAFLTILAKRRKFIQKVRSSRPRKFISVRVAYWLKAYPKFFLLLTAFLTALSLVVFVVQYRSISEGTIIESDLSKLRDKTSETSGSGYNSHYLHQIFQKYPHPMVILPEERSTAIKIASRFKEKMKEPNSPFAAVTGIEDFLPKDQPEKIRILREIKKLLGPRILKELTGEDKRRVQELLAPEVFRPISVQSLPHLIQSKLSEKDGTIGKLVLVEPHIGKTEDRDGLIHFIQELRKTVDEVMTGVPIAGGLAVSVDMIYAIQRDGPIATALAFLSVIVLVIFLFRRVRIIFLCLFTLVLGVLWLVAYVLAFNLKINFLNFIAFPITFGIGVDYGVNVFQRYRMDGEKNILKTIRQTGGAVMLASLTTIIGYGSLLLAGNQAFVSFGKLAVLGELTCLFAAVFALPAYLTLTDKRNQK